MKVLIQQDQSGYYLDASGTWVPEQDLALAFEHGADAVNHCIHNQLSGVHLLYCDSNPEMDFAFNPFNSKLAPAARRLVPDPGPEPPIQDQ